MGQRKSIGPKLRFEVFKRDLFTCQYCGRKAPDVVLHCDHVKPVASNGRGDIEDFEVPYDNWLERMGRPW